MKIQDYDFYTSSFDDQLNERIEFLKNNFDKTPITLCGNPFVDVGIYITAIHQGKSIDEIYLRDVLETILNIDGLKSNGRMFAIRNFRTKTISKVLFNNPLNQAAYGSTKKGGVAKSPSKDQPSPLQERLYRVYLIEFLLSYAKDLTTGEIQELAANCMICGTATTFDFNELETVIKALAGQKRIEKKDDFGSGPTRTWMPLLGTTSSIQALPAFTEPNTICGKCLTLSQFIIQAVDLQNGLLTLYQSPDHKFVLEFYRRNFEKFNERHNLVKIGEDKLEIVGSENSDYYINNLLKIISENYVEMNGTSLTLWKFDNYGTDPHIETIQLPDRTLYFLYVTMERGYENVIRRYIKYEEKNNIYQNLTLINSILRKSDYFLFYPHTKYEIEELVPQEFFELYQIYIRGWNEGQINTAQKISKFVKEKFDDEDELERALKERDRYKLRTYLIPKIIQALTDEVILIEDVLKFFEYYNPEMIDNQPWKLFQYYLHPKLNVNNENYNSTLNSLVIDKEREFYLKIISKVADQTRVRMENRSSFDFEKYLDQLSRMVISDFKSYYVRTGESYINLTWEILEKLVSQFNNYQILFWFRLFTVNPHFNETDMSNQLNLERVQTESGLHPIMVSTLVSYLEERIEKIGKNRTFKELLYDLNYNKYSKYQFFQLLLKFNNEEQKDREFEFNEYHFFTYEIEYAGKFKTTNSRKPTFSWHTMRNKLILFINQYRELRKTKLEQEIMEEKI